MYVRTFLLLVIAPIHLPNETYSQSPDVKTLTLDDAKRIVSAAEQRAREDDWNVVIAIQKARTAVFYPDYAIHIPVRYWEKHLEQEEYHRKIWLSALI